MSILTDQQIKAQNCTYIFVFKDKYFRLFFNHYFYMVPYFSVQWKVWNHWSYVLVVFGVW